MTLKEEEIQRIAEYEHAQAEARMRRSQARQEEQARQQTAVRLRDEQSGREWHEVMSTRSFRQHTFRDANNKRLKTYNTRAGQEDQAYTIIDFHQVAPRRTKRDR
jgi:hypothetical protein